MDASLPPEATSEAVIQRLEADPGKPDRIFVTVGPPDGDPTAASTFGLHIAVVAHEALYVGMACPPAVVERLQASDVFQQHYDRALNFLAVRPRSVAEVRLRLRRKATPPEILDAIVERLLRVGYLDDAAFARYWIGERARSRPRGARLLRQELRQKGVAAPVVEAALSEHAAEAEDQPVPGAVGAAVRELGATDEPRAVREALGLAQRRARTYAGLDAQTYRRRLGGFLLRRGYDYEVVARVFKLLAAVAEGAETLENLDEGAP